MLELGGDHTHFGRRFGHISFRFDLKLSLVQILMTGQTQGDEISVMGATPATLELHVMDIQLEVVVDFLSANSKANDSR